MARVLVADTPEGAPTLLRILRGHQCTVVNTMQRAKSRLAAEDFDLILAALHFDSSQMFEFMREVKQHPRNSDKPLICFCSRDTPLSRLVHESVECTTRVYGAWMYLDEHAYNVYQNPDAELRRVMERCLTEEARKEIHQQRLDIQSQRTQLQELRTLLQHQEWSPGMKEHLLSVKHELEYLRTEATRLKSAAELGRASVAASRDLKDRVSEHVQERENGMATAEDSQAETEGRQFDSEEELTATEELKEHAS